MRYRSLLCSVVAAALLCVASQAGAVTTTINATFESLIGVGDATISGLDVPNGSEGCSMGSMYFRVNSIDGIAPVAGTGFTAYCVDVHDDIGWGQTDTWTLTYLADVPHGFQMGATTAGQVAKLFGEVAGDSNVDSDPTKAAAFQAALWQIINGPGFKVTCGETDVMTQAQTYLDDLATAPTATDVCAIVSSDTQDFAFVVPNTNYPLTSSVVPEPITFLTGLMVVSGLGAYIRRRTRVAKV